MFIANAVNIRLCISEMYTFIIITKYRLSFICIELYRVALEHMTFFFRTEVVQWLRN